MKSEYTSLQNAANHFLSNMVGCLEWQTVSSAGGETKNQLCGKFSSIIMFLSY